MMTSDETGDVETTSTQTRWRFTGTLLAGAIILAYAGVVATYVYRGQPVPLWASTTFSLVMLAAATWTFGGQAIGRALEAWSGQVGER